MATTKKYYRNLLKNGMVGKSIKKSKFRKAGKFATHPDEKKYTDITEKCRERLKEMGVSDSEIQSMIKDPYDEESLFYGRE